MTEEEYENMKIDYIIENNEWYAKLLIDSEEEEDCSEEIETCLDIARWLRELKERRKNDVKVKSDNTVNSKQ